MPGLLLFLTLGLAVTTALLAPWAGSPRAVSACSIGTGERSIDKLAARSDAVALVEVVSAGDSVNRTPPRATTPVPLSPEVQAQLFDLKGYGARVRVVELISGAIAGEVEVDAAVRRLLEEGLRGIEAAGNPVPCRLDNLRTRYEPGARYAVLLIEHDGGWQTQIAYLVSGQDALVTNDYSPDAVSPPLTIGIGLYETFFQGIEATADVNDDGQFWTIDSARVPLASLLGAMKVAHAASIRPPTTGSGGLADRP